MPSPLPSPTTLVAAIDPGKVTGLSYFVASDNALSVPQAHELTVPEFFDHFHDTFQRVDADDNLNMVVAVEKFQISERTIKTAMSLEALDILGWLRAEQFFIRRRPIVEYTPAQTKRFATDEKLKSLGWFERTKDGHANDANRVLLTWIMTSEWPVRDHVIAYLAKELLK